MFRMASIRHAKERSSGGQSAGRASAAAASENGSRREAILEAGVEIFGRTPYDQVSIDDLADHAGVAHGLLFHYFKSKRGLYLAALRRTADELRAIHAAPRRSTSPGRDVRAIINRHIDYIETHPQALLAYSGGVGADPEARAILEESRWEGIMQILGAIGIDRPSQSTKIAMRGFVGFLDESMTYCLSHGMRIPRKQIREMSIEVIVCSLVLAGAGRGDGQADPRSLLSNARDHDSER
jgi:AcrR family transcriptional regulator